MIGGPIVSYIISMFIYGFGEHISDTKDIRDNLREIDNHIPVSNMYDTNKISADINATNNGYPRNENTQSSVTEYYCELCNKRCKGHYYVKLKRGGKYKICRDCYAREKQNGQIL